jgi:uncharacterized membrane protein
MDPKRGGGVGDGDDRAGRVRLGGGPWFLFFPLLWIGLFVGAFLLFRRRRDHWQTHSAEEVLAERYAKGEISADEYHQGLSVLRGRER